MAFEQVGVEAVVKGKSQYLSDIGAMQQKTGGFTGFLKTSFAVAIGTSVVPALGALSRGIGSIVGDAAEAQRVMTQTNAVIASTGGKAGMSAQGVSDLAEQLSKVIPIDDELIQSTENMLLTFTNVGKDVFPGATEAALDMSVALGEDSVSSAMRLGKALNDPIQGVTALRRVGVQLTDAQEAQIKSFMAVGDVASAQKIILGELSTEFGNSARAAGETFAGKMTILKTQIGNVKESIGGALLPALTTMVGFFSQSIPKAIDMVGVGMSKLTGWFDKIVGFGMPGSPIESIGENFRHLGDAFKAAFSGEGVTSSGVMGMVEQAGVSARSFIDSLKQVGSTLKDIFGPVATTLRTTLVPALAETGMILGGALTDHIKTLVDAFMTIAQQAAPLVVDVLQVIIQVAARLLPTIAEIIAIGTKLVDTLIQWAVNSGLVGTAIDGLTTIFNFLAPVVVGLAEVIQKVVHWIGENETVVKILTIALGALLVALFPVPAAILAIVVAVGYLSNHFDDLVAAGQSVIDTIEGIPVLGPIIVGAVDLIVGTIQAWIDVFADIIQTGKDVISFFSNVFQGDWEGAWNDIKDIALDIVNTFLDYIRTGWMDDLLEVFRNMAPRVLGAIGNLTTTLLQKGVDLVTGIFTGITQFATGTLFPWVVRLPAVIIEKVGNVTRTLLPKGIELLTGLWNGWVQYRDQTLFPFLARLPGEVVNKIGDIANTLRQKGVDLIRGFFNGLKDLWDREVRGWLNLRDKILSAVGDLSNILYDLGRSVLDGMRRGMESIIPDLVRVAGNVKDKVKEKLDPRNWFSTPEEHYRKLWGAAFRSIGEEADSAMPKLTSSAGAIKDTFDVNTVMGDMSLGDWEQWFKKWGDSPNASGGLQAFEHWMIGAKDTYANQFGANGDVIFGDMSLNDWLLWFKKWGDTPNLSGGLHAFQTWLETAKQTAVDQASTMMADVATAFTDGADAVVGASDSAANKVGTTIGSSLGDAIRAGMQTILDAIPTDNLIGALEDFRSVVGDLRGEMGRLIGLPTKEAAQEQLELAQLNLDRFKLETGAAAEAANREARLGALRSQLAAARSAENDDLVAQLQTQISTVEDSLGPNERAIEQIDNQIDAVKRLVEQRKLEHDILDARAAIADQTLIDDKGLTDSAEAWIEQIYESTKAIGSQVGDINTQYIPALKALKDAQDAAAASALAQAKAAELMKINPTAGALASIGAGLSGSDVNAGLGRALQSLGNVGNTNFLESFLVNVSKGQSPEQALNLLFGPNGAFPKQAQAFKQALLDENLVSTNDFRVTMLAGVADPITAGINQLGNKTLTAAGATQAITTPLVGAQEAGTSAIGMLDTTTGQVGEDITSGIYGMNGDLGKLIGAQGPDIKLIRPGLDLISFGTKGVIDAVTNVLNQARIIFDVLWLTGRSTALQEGILRDIATYSGQIRNVLDVHSGYLAQMIGRMDQLIAKPSVAFATAMPSAASAAGANINIGSISVQGASLTKGDVAAATYDGTTAALRAKGLVQ